MFSAGAGVPALCLPNGRDQNDNAERIEALGLGRSLSPEAAPATIAQAVTAMLTDTGLRANCRAFAARVRRFGDLLRAADLIIESARAVPAPPAVRGSRNSPCE
jgi:UDP:flavonoid glycosyltransferase YjiC (YdhE family)